ncbi:hypothetical protein CPC08DRAFT_765234 [Agrocybe pediades]|nr:hypothetical protein CPC08DRAFT_765234 [Agrocybe pediades]
MPGPSNKRKAKSKTKTAGVKAKAQQPERGGSTASIATTILPQRQLEAGRRGVGTRHAMVYTSGVGRAYEEDEFYLEDVEEEGDGNGRRTNSTPSSPSLNTPSPPPPPPAGLASLTRSFEENDSMAELETRIIQKKMEVFTLEEDVSSEIEKALFEEPFIHDPGNGPRVRKPRAFMGSFFAQPPAWDDPLCAEFAQEELLQMLCTILPEETALILWYNKSRSHSRVCPSCQRLYRLGDALPDLTDAQGGKKSTYTSPQLIREQRISGLCSPVCFIMASFNYPEAIKSAWGCMADDMDDESWERLNTPASAEGAATATESETSKVLGLLMRMTRLHDLGLAQLCFGEDEVEEREEEEGYGRGSLERERAAVVSPS